MPHERLLDQIHAKLISNSLYVSPPIEETDMVNSMHERAKIAVSPLTPATTIAALNHVANEQLRPPTLGLKIDKHASLDACHIVTYPHLIAQETLSSKTYREIKQTIHDEIEPGFLARRGIVAQDDISIEKKTPNIVRQIFVYVFPDQATVDGFIDYHKSIMQDGRYIRHKYKGIHYTMSNPTHPFYFEGQNGQSDPVKSTARGLRIFPDYEYFRYHKNTN